MMFKVARRMTRFQLVHFNLKTKARRTNHHLKSKEKAKERKTRKIA